MVFCVSQNTSVKCKKTASKQTVQVDNGRDIFVFSVHEIMSLEKLHPFFLDVSMSMKSKKLTLK